MDICVQCKQMFEITFKCNGKKMYYETYSVIIQINIFLEQ